MAKGRVTIGSFDNKNQSRRLQSRRNGERRLYRLHKLRENVP